MLSEDLKDKSLAELKVLESQLQLQIETMDGMRVSQIQREQRAAGIADSDLSNFEYLNIRAKAGADFQELQQLHILLSACQRRIEQLSNS